MLESILRTVDSSIDLSWLIEHLFRISLNCAFLTYSVDPLEHTIQMASSIFYMDTLVIHML